MDMMEIRRRVLMASKKKRLPSAYQEVEYIESTGTQWIDTGISPAIHTWAKLKFVNLVVSGYVIFGYYNSEYTSWRMFNNSPNLNYLDLPSNEKKSYRYMTGVETGIYPNKLIELEIGNKFKKILRNDGYPELITTEFNGTPIDDFVSTTKTLTLNYHSDNHISLNRWYYVKIYDEDTLVRNMIPCYRKSDGEIGMYDTVSKTFYTNAGTGTFLKGADV